MFHLQNQVKWPVPHVSSCCSVGRASDWWSERVMGSILIRGSEVFSSEKNKLVTTRVILSPKIPVNQMEPVGKNYASKKFPSIPPPPPPPLHNFSNDLSITFTLLASPSSFLVSVCCGFIQLCLMSSVSFASPSSSSVHHGNWLAAARLALRTGLLILGELKDSSESDCAQEMSCKIPN